MRRLALGPLVGLLAAAAHAQGVADTRDVVIVTGEKFPRPLQQTAASVRVLSQAQIEDNNFDEAADVYRHTPNVASRERSGAFAIRGVDVFGVSGGGNSFLSSVYVDGAVLPQQGIAGGPLDLWDVARFEILRGPQSTLQGRNALAGAIVIESRDPAYEWDWRTRATLSEFGGRSLAFAGGGPIVDDQLAFRVSGKTGRLNGFSRNPQTGRDTDFDRRDQVRGKLLFEPRAIPALRGLLTLAYDEHLQGSRFTYAGRRGAARDIPFDTENFEETRTGIATLTLKYDLGDAWTLTSVSSHNSVDYVHEIDADYSALPTSTLWAEQDADTFSQEVRAQFDTGAASGVLGAYYYRWEETQAYGGRSRLTFAGLGIPQLLTAAPPAGLGLPSGTAAAVLSLYAPANPVLVDTVASDPDETESVALFADARVALTDRLTLYGGARWEHENQRAAFASTVDIANLASFPNPQNPALGPTLSALVAGLNARLSAMAQQANGNVGIRQAEFDAFLPKLGIGWAWTEDVETSFVVQRAYRPGGLGANIARSNAYGFEPEYAWNHELALRSAWLDDRLAVNANAFYLDWKDQQVLVQLSGNRYDTEIRNAGASHLYGLEAELSYAATSNVDVFAGAGYVRTRFDTFMEDINGTITDLSGRQFPGAPAWTVSLGGTWRGGGGFFLNANAAYADASHAFVNPNTFGVDPKIESRAVVNAMAGYETSRFAVYVFARNLFDDHYVVSPDRGDGVNILGAPQLFGLRIDAAL